jgi:hypothetical protein
MTDEPREAKPVTSQGVWSLLVFLAAAVTQAACIIYFISTFDLHFGGGEGDPLKTLLNKLLGVLLFISPLANLAGIGLGICGWVNDQDAPAAWGTILNFIVFMIFALALSFTL